jgi:hypothetical protein
MLAARHQQGHLLSVEGEVLRPAGELKLDRLTRSVRDLGALLDGYFHDRFALLSVMDSIDTRTAGGRLVLNVLASVSQWERETIAERTRTALAFKREQGVKLGRRPIEEVREDGAEIVARVAALQREGLNDARHRRAPHGRGTRDLARRGVERRHCLPDAAARGGVGQGWPVSLWARAPPRRGRFRPRCSPVVRLDVERVWSGKGKPRVAAGL